MSNEEILKEILSQEEKIMAFMKVNEKIPTKDVKEMLILKKRVQHN